MNGRANHPRLLLVMRGRCGLDKTLPAKAGCALLEQIRSLRLISCGCEVIGAFLSGELRESVSDGVPKVVDVAGGVLVQFMPGPSGAS